MIYFISTAVFSSVVITLVLILLLVESKVVVKGEREITINDDPERSIKTPGGRTLLAALSRSAVAPSR